MLKNKFQTMSLQPTKISDHLTKTLQDIQSKLQIEIQGFEEFSQRNSTFLIVAIAISLSLTHEGHF